MSVQHRYGAPCSAERRTGPGQREPAEGKEAAWANMAASAPEVVYDRIRDRERALGPGRCPWMTEEELEEEGGVGEGVEDDEDDEDGPEGYHCQICGYHTDQLQPFNVHLHSAHPAVVLQELYGLLGLTGGPIPGLGPFGGLVPGLGPFGSVVPGQTSCGGPVPNRGLLRGLILSQGMSGGHVASLGLPGGPVLSQDLSEDSVPSQGVSGGPVPSQGVSGGPVPSQGLSGGPVPSQGLYGGSIPNQGPSGGSIPNQGLSGGSIPNQDLSGGSIPNQGPSGGSVPSPGLSEGTSPSQRPSGGPVSGRGLPALSLLSQARGGGHVPSPVQGEGRLDGRVKPDIVHIDLTGEDEAGGREGAAGGGPGGGPSPACSPSPTPSAELEPGAEGPLAEAFSRFPYPSPEELARCGLSAGLSAERVRVWFAVQRLRHGISWTPEEVREARHRLSSTLRLPVPPTLTDGHLVLAPAYDGGGGGGGGVLALHLLHPKEACASPGERRCRKAQAQALRAGIARQWCEEEVQRPQARTAPARSEIERWFSDSHHQPRGPPGEAGPSPHTEPQPGQASPAPSGRPRKTKEQLSVLKAFFLRSRWPSGADYSLLVERTGLARADVIQWFGDTRYALKNGQLKWVHRGLGAGGGGGGAPQAAQREDPAGEGLCGASSAEWLRQKRRRRRRRRRTLLSGRGDEGEGGGDSN
ncbi:collagen alpha-2(I) chain-like [Chiloscyllium plagiosum]|uniref:collagen alpha-2(I) chain-like n=1 Tax=Chiloscyllium plagiosum TaxID=36176 RepID=UPI001CB7D060|nr:collagen alpha-2(I) chain-like [Chiloscyllium plagiosum]